MFCEKCGAEVPEGTKFCPKCGNDLSSVTIKKQPAATATVDSFKNTWNSWGTGKKVIAIIVVCCIGLFLIGSIMSIISPDANTSTSDSSSVDDSESEQIKEDLKFKYSDDDSSSSSSSSSDDDYSYSSSSNGRDVSSHYEGEEGTQDTHGTFHDDGSVESHATGKTKYGNDYQIDSYMDKNGNVHGSVNIDGKTYTV